MIPLQFWQLGNDPSHRTYRLLRSTAGDELRDGIPEMDQRLARPCPMSLTRRVPGISMSRKGLFQVHVEFGELFVAQMGQERSLESVVLRDAEEEGFSEGWVCKNYFPNVRPGLSRAVSY